jgi:hypothetical protein
VPAAALLDERHRAVPVVPLEVQGQTQSDDAPADHQEVGRRRGSAGIARLYWSFSLDSGWDARLRRVSVAYSQSNLMGVSLNEVERVVF